MQRKVFIQKVGLVSAGIIINKPIVKAASRAYPVVCPPLAKRNFTSKAVEDTIVQFKANVKDQKLALLFENYFSNMLDTTIFYAIKEARPDTYVITEDIDAM